MLQMLIYHYKDGGHRIEEITRLYSGDSELLARFDEVAGTTDVDVCKPYVGQRILIQHDFEDDNTKTYEVIANLQGIDINENGKKYVSYIAESRVAPLEEE